MRKRQICLWACLIFFCLPVLFASPLPAAERYRVKSGDSLHKIAKKFNVSVDALKEANQVKFVPSYWITPLVMYDRIIKKQWVVLFGARPAHVALVPGEVVPEAMLRGLKALSDPTRLLILRYLSDSPLTQSQLARKLRLRAPTVIHHLSALRLAGLVYVSLDAENEKRYTVRKFAVKDTFDALRKFLFVKGESNT